MTLASPEFVGIQQVTDEDRAYRGSRFAEVRDALFSQPYQKVWGAPGEPPLPIYSVTLAPMLRGFVPFLRPALFRKSAERTVDSGADLRWGPDRKGYRRLIHPIAVCLAGHWQITEDTEYSGCFRKGGDALMVARYSTCCAETRRGYIRSLSMVGKLWPTADPDHAEPLRTANFFSQQDIAGGIMDYINDVELKNAPDVSAWRRGSGIPVFGVTAIALAIVDRKTTIRQLYPIAELGKPSGERTRAPTFMRLLVAPEQPRIAGEQLDFRDEIMAQIYDRGDPQPKRTLTYHIEVTDDGQSRGPQAFLRRTFQNWRHIGKITFTQAAASYNGDFVIHFSHPTWRDNQNDPATATRVQGRKVRFFG